MKFLADLLGGGVVKTVGDIADELITSDEERAKAGLKQYRAETKRIEVEQAGRLAQIRVNQIEAKHKSVFVSGWRPFIGWTCGTGFAIHVIILPITYVACAIWAPEVVMPDIDTTLILSVMGGILGIAIPSRSFEKIKGVASFRVK